MLLSELHWGGPQSLEELDTWGLDPLKEFIEIFDETYGQRQNISEPEDGRAVFLYYQMRGLVEGIEQTLYRFMTEMDGDKSIEDRNKILVDRIPQHSQHKAYAALTDILSPPEPPKPIDRAKMKKQFEALQKIPAEYQPLVHDFLMTLVGI